MVAPSGVRGVHVVPKAGQSCGFLRPRSTCPLMHTRRFLRFDIFHLEAIAPHRDGDTRSAACNRSWK